MIEYVRQSSESLDALDRLSRSSPSLLFLSDHATARAILPPTNSRQEYQVAVSHPHMYPQERERLDAITIPSGHDVELACFGLVDLTYSQYNGDPYEVAGPSQLPEYADPRLRRLDISHWTQVEVSDSWTAQALSLYLVTDHAVATLIDADLFIRDLVEKQTVFCSRLLVSSLMFWASVSRLCFRSLTCCSTALTTSSKVCLSSIARPR